MKKLALLLPALLALVACNNSKFPVKTLPAPVALTSGGNYDVETSAVAIPPGAKCGDGTPLPNGRLVVASGGSKLDSGGAQRVLLRDLVGGAATKSLPLSDKSVFPIEQGDFGSGDNQIVRLRNGDLLLFWLGSTWTEFKDSAGNHPAWWNDTEPPGTRGAIHVWRSRTCGDTWLYDATMDSARIKVPNAAADPTHQNDEGRCAWPQNGSLNGKYWFGGWDREQVYVDPFDGRVYVSAGCMSGSATFDVPDLVCEFSGFEMDCKVVATPTPLHPGRQFEATVLFTSNTPFATDLSDPLVSIPSAHRGTPAALTTTDVGSLFVHQCLAGPTLHRQTQPESGVFQSFGVHSLFNTPNLKDCHGLPGDRLAAGDPNKGAELLVGDPKINAENLSVSRVWRAPGSGVRVVRLAYPAVEGYAVKDGKVTAGRQVWMVTTVMLKADGTASSVITHRVAAKDPKGSVLHATFVETDRMEMKDDDEDAALLYWVEEIPGAGGPPAGKLIVRGQVVRDSAEWSEVFNLSGEWTPAFKSDGWRGDYMHGAFYYADGNLNFVAQWPQTDQAHTAGGVIQPNMNVYYNVVTVARRTGDGAAPAPSPPNPPNPPSPLGPPARPNQPSRLPDDLMRAPDERRTERAPARLLTAPKTSAESFYYGGCAQSETTVAVGVLAENPRAVELRYFLREAGGGAATPEVARPMTRAGGDPRAYAFRIRGEHGELPAGYEGMRDPRLFYYVVVTDARGAQTRGEVYGEQPGSAVRLSRCGG